MEFNPHPYQEKAIQHILEHNEAGLFLDLGLGKTVCTLTAISEIMYDRFEVRKVLIIAPLRVAESTWTDEARKWDHLEYLNISRVLGSERQRLRALRRRADIYVINRENVDWLVNHYGVDWPFDMLVIDELSSFKSSKARRFRALRRVRPFFTRAVGLTGTPTPNGLLDLWPQLYLLDMGERLGTRFTQYREEYFEPDRKGWVNGQPKVYSYVPKDGASEVIERSISDICISMSAKDWLDLKDPISRVVSVVLPKKAYEHYEKLEREMLLPLDKGEVIASTAAVLSNKLLQVANGAVYDDEHEAQWVHDAKLDALEDLVEAANGKPVLVCYSFKHDLQRIKKRFPNATVFKSQADMRRWNSGQVPMMLVHPASAGHGVNLQAGGNIIIWFSVPWSLELYQQANGRLHRQGQTQQVIINHLIAHGTIDEEVLDAVRDKAAGQDALLAAVKARIDRVRQANSPE